MVDSDKDEMPMLSDTLSQPSHENFASHLKAFTSRTRSASFSIPMHSMESYENRTNLVGHTGPLRNEQRSPSVQMSGPLYIGHKPEAIFIQNQGIAGQKKTEPKVEKFSSFSEVEDNEWSDNKNVGKNEHLLRSGQLGMCNDPYCTTCPTYYNFKPAQRRSSKVSGIFDPKVFHHSRLNLYFLQSFLFGIL